MMRRERGREDKIIVTKKIATSRGQLIVCIQRTLHENITSVLQQFTTACAVYAHTGKFASLYTVKLAVVY